MFGFGKKNKTYDVRLTEKQIREIEKNMKNSGRTLVYRLNMVLLPITECRKTN